VFVRSFAPYRAFSDSTSFGLSNRCACDAPRRYQLLEGNEEQLISSVTLWPAVCCGGSILQDIAGMLRHGSLLTTEIYAKVDVLTLRQIAQPWPEVKACSLRRCKRIWLCAELWDSG
jgi:oligoribonuclease (3'-5' exoribonuclease)